MKKNLYDSKVVVKSADDWIKITIDDEVIINEHSCTAVKFLEELGVNFESQNYEQWLENNGYSPNDETKMDDFFDNHF